MITTHAKLIPHLCTGLAASIRFYHTKIAHLDQNLGLNRHTLTLLVNDNTVECMFLKKKWNYQETIHDGTIVTKLYARKPVCGPSFLKKSQESRNSAVGNYFCSGATLWRPHLSEGWSKSRFIASVLIYTMRSWRKF